MNNIKRVEGQSLSVAVMLAVDNYKYNPDPKAISATTLLQPLRMLILRALKGNDKVDIEIGNIVASRTGTAVHTMLEESWLNPSTLKKVLARLDCADLKVKVNPPDNPAALKKLRAEGVTVVWVEQYAERAVSNRIVTGTFDFCGGGILEDLKNTGAFKVKEAMAEIFNFNDELNALPVTKLDVEDYYTKLEAINAICPTVFNLSMQGSIYKFLNPDKIKDDVMLVQFIIKDYKKGEALKDITYPQTNPYQLSLPLFTHAEVEGWIYYKLKLLEEGDLLNLPLCTTKELWMSDETWKVYAKADSKRCVNGGTFTSLQAANHFLSQRKSGVVKKIANPPRRCGYCSVRNNCSQADTLGVPINK